LLARVVQRDGIEIIHAHNYEALLAGWIVGRVTGRPVVYHSHNVMTAELPTYFRRPWVQHLAARLAQLLDHELPRRAEACIALSPEAVPFFEACGVPEDRIRLIPPGIEFEAAAACEVGPVRARHQLGSGPLVIYTGNLDQYQRVESLVRSFRTVHAARPDAQLVIASHSPAAQYRAVCAHVGESAAVRFIHCERFDEMRDLLLAADVAICPRMICFGFPIKLLNYMAAGKAVVVAQGSAKGIRHLKNGYVVSDEEAALAEGVVHLLNDARLRQRLGTAARATVEGRYQWSHAVREIERCYHQLTSGRTEPVVVDGRLA
jgi:glycosyltransferase involved in cell wall biosynthesis